MNFFELNLIIIQNVENWKKYWKSKMDGNYIVKFKWFLIIEKLMNINKNENSLNKL